MHHAQVLRLDRHPRTLIDEYLCCARGCIGIADRRDLLVQTKRPNMPDAFAYVMQAQVMVIRVYALIAFVTDEQQLFLAYLEKMIERLVEEDRLRVSLHEAKVIDLAIYRDPFGLRKVPAAANDEEGGDGT